MSQQEYYVLEVPCKFLNDFQQRHAETFEEVVLVLLRPGRRVLVHTKAFYPSNVYRLPSGKVGKNESPIEAAQREIAEETGLQPAEIQKIGEIIYMLRCNNCKQEFRSHVFLCAETFEKPQPTSKEEEITDFKEVDILELKAIADQLRNLPAEWSSWGQMRAVAHDFVYYRLKSLFQFDKAK
ncbi:MAG: NUDIX hydrolase [Armatimonadota bacterium]|nr:NUDIX hydrolase [Armatimonadota bacterium]